jgi:O-antigen ligase/tetratricopeptide (TPR) repeat protein
MRIKNKIKKEAPTNLFASVILILYVVVAVFTPQMGAFDSNGPKFLSLAVLNLLVFLLLLSRKEFSRQHGQKWNFLKTNGGKVIALFLIVTFLSLVKSINLSESILYICKTSTVFIAGYFVYLLVSADKRCLEPLSVAMVIFLILDSLTVYYNIGKFISGELSDIELIRSVYSNKNVLAASIFIKIPFALWLYTFHKDWKQKLAFAGWAMSFLAILFLSSRAFYLGILVISVAYLINLWVLYRREGQKAYRGKMVFYMVVLIASVALFTVVQKNLYSRPSIYNAGIVARLSQAKSTEYSTGERLRGWQRSLEVIKNEPLLGCGAGNWKIATLKQENQTKTDLIYQYRAHNDFIEVTTETGIPGGLLFLSLFILLIWPYTRSLIKKQESDHLYYLFLPAFGMGAYAIDAFFNFPHDRPEIQILFALFIGSGIALTQNKTAIRPGEKNDQPNVNHKKGVLEPIQTANRLLTPIFTGGVLALVLGSIYILALNFESLKMQKVVSDEIASGKLTLSSQKIASGFPWIPNNNIFGEPIAVQKARYLFQEKKFGEAIDLLKKENPNPFDSRREYFIASAYFSMGKPDSALSYARQVLQIKPYLLENIKLMSNIYEQQGKIEETIPLLEKYLSQDKNSSKAWLMLTSCLDKSGDLKKAIAFSDSAFKYLPNDALIIQNQDYLHTKQLVYPYNETYEKAAAHYKASQYEQAIELFGEIISNGVRPPKIFELRALCYYFSKQYPLSMKDIDYLFSLGLRKPNMVNLQGVNMQNTGRQTEACALFKEAMKSGDPQGKSNFNQFCK